MSYWNGTLPGSRESGDGGRMQVYNMHALRSDPTVCVKIKNAAIGAQWRRAERNDRIISILAETSYAKQSFTLLQSPNMSNWSRDVA